ncbi:MAG: zf-HC2 domain-containing protein [Acidobacteria bacterium]|nr:zf-HC2 domain-containing protein [Acidobacteriota bacterium]
MTCQQLTELVTEYLENRLSFTDRLRFRMHVGMCRHCRAYIDQMRQTVRTLGRLPAEEIPPEVRDALLVQFRNWKRQ